jgi:apolipoprotein N-acyltransferase
MMSFLKNYAIAVASGVLLAVAFPDYHVYPLAWLALAPVIWRTWNLTPRQTAGHFFVAGFSFYLILLHWLMSNVYWAGGWAFWGYVALAIVMALFWAVAGWAWAHLRSVLPWCPAALTLAVLWGAMEHLQSFAFTGFGWGGIGYSQGKDLPLLQLAALGGVSLLSAVIVAGNALIASILGERQRRLTRALVACMLVALAHAVGWLLLDSAEYGDDPYTVGLLQSDFPLEMKWDPEYTVDMVQNAAQKSRMLDQIKPVDLFIWPESLIMDDIDSPQILPVIQSLTLDTEAALLAGTHRSDRDSGGSLNSSHLVAHDGSLVDYYDKIHLAPFGEYAPLSNYLPFISKVVPAIGDIQPGTIPKVFTVDGRTLGPLICFEVLFSPMSARLRSEGADLLIVMTNLGWFGASSAIGQELEIARVRAVETRLPLAHCANTGITGMFDPWGRFTLVDTYFDGRGNAYQLGAVSPADTRMHRLGGVLPAALPGPHLFPLGPRLVPNVLLAIVCILAIWAAICSFRGSTKHRRKINPE